MGDLGFLRQEVMGDLGFSMNTEQELTKKNARERRRRSFNNQKNSMKEIRDPDLGF